MVSAQAIDMIINKKSNYLTLLVATYNRLKRLKRTLYSIRQGVSCSHEVIVIDAGSTDGTIQYLKSNTYQTPVFQGKLFGVALAYNKVWKHIKSKYTSYLSDDTEIVKGSIDEAVHILERDTSIGIVGLKMREMIGPWKHLSFKTGISEYGIVNCNHGVLPMEILAKVGYYNERYFSYFVDPDLTASILCTGKKAVMTKKIGILHFREWSENMTDVEVKKKVKQSMKGVDYASIYREKFRFLKGYMPLEKKYIPPLVELALNIPGWQRQYWRILLRSRFISLSDPIKTVRNPFHLVQRIPKHLLESELNPYRKLLV